MVTLSYNESVARVEFRGRKTCDLLAAAAILRNPPAVELERLGLPPGTHWRATADRIEREVARRASRRTRA